MNLSILPPASAPNRTIVTAPPKRHKKRKTSTRLVDNAPAAPKPKKRSKIRKPKLSAEAQMMHYMKRKITKYPFKQMKKGSWFIISATYSRREMSLKSNAARNWKNKSKLCKRWKFALSKTDDNQIMITRVK